MTIVDPIHTFQDLVDHQTTFLDHFNQVFLITLTFYQTSIIIIMVSTSEGLHYLTHQGPKNQIYTISLEITSILETKIKILSRLLTLYHQYLIGYYRNFCKLLWNFYIKYSIISFVNLPFFLT